MEITPPVVAKPWTLVARLYSFHVTPACARTRRVAGIDMDAAHRREIDHQAAVGRREPRDVVAAAAHRDLDAGVAAEVDGVANVGGVRATRDEPGALVDQAVVDAPGVVVAGCVGSEELAAERRRQFVRYVDRRHQVPLSLARFASQYARRSEPLTGRSNWWPAGPVGMGWRPCSSTYQTADMFDVIVVGTDGSDSASVAVQRAATLATLTGATLHIVSAYRHVSLGSVAMAASAGATTVDLEQVNRGVTAQGQEVCERAATNARRAGVNVELHAVPGDAADVLVDVATQVGADLVVVGNRGMSGARRFVLGSVPNKVSHHCPCSLLVIDTTADPA